MGIGDEILTTGMARVAQQNDPRKCRILYQGKMRWHPVFDHNPRIARLEEEGDFQIIHARDASNMRPYHIAKSTERWTYNLDFRPERGELYFSVGERAFSFQHSPEIIVAPDTKVGASPNKSWPREYWQEFCKMARAAGFKVSQFAFPGHFKIEGVTQISTPAYRQAAAVLARAKGFVGQESGLHHTAAALNIPGVVIMGGFTPIELTGYGCHRNLGVSLGDACGLRVKCAHCEAEMRRITPELVLQQLREVLACPKN